LHATDWISVGETYGRVKSMEDEHGKRLKVAGPSRAVRISGLKSVPAVAEIMQSFKDEKDAREESDKAKKYAHVKKFSNVKKIGLDELTAQVAALDKNELNLVIKADVVGSLDAIKESLSKLNNEYVGVKFIGEGVGDVLEKDIQMASSSDKIVIGFKVGKSPGVEGTAKSNKVKILNYDVIYELIDDIKTLLAEMMPIEKTEIPVGVIKVLGVFKVSPHLTVAGGKVEDGRAEKGVNIRVKRNGEVIGEYVIAHVQREKEEVPSVPAGSECGFSIEQKADIAIDDVIELYRTEEHKKTL
jgi:translation initiation factor IF-2